MAEQGVDQIFIISAIGEGPEKGRVERGIGGKLLEKSVNAVSVSVLKENMQAFFHQLREILDIGKDAIGAFEVSQVEIAAQITGDGQVCLMGSGVKLEVQGGIKFVLSRTLK
jgi:hypothetical protein